MASSRTVVVTGATGFIGKKLVQRLGELDIHVVPVSRETGFDIRNKKSLEKIASFDSLIHLAARTFVPDSYAEPEDYFLTNVLGTLNCLELCRKRKASLVFASSYVYGPPKTLPVSEYHPVSAWNPYATTKIMAEDLCRMYARDFGVPNWVFRIFNIYGPGQTGDFLIPKIIKGIKTGYLELETSTPKRDFVYVDDVVAALLLPLEKDIPQNQIFNVGSGASISVEDLVRKVIALCQSKVQVSYKEVSRKSDVKDVVADVKKISSFGWCLSTGLDQGLQTCIENQVVVNE